MVRVTISLSDAVYAWLVEKATSGETTVEELLEEEVARLREGDPDEPKFLAAVRETIDSNRNLLKRLAE